MWLEVILLGLGLVATIGWMARDLPLQNVLGAALTLLFLSFGMLVVGYYAHLPLAPSAKLSPFPMPTNSLAYSLIPFRSLVVILNARGTARMLARFLVQPESRGLWSLGLGAGLGAASLVLPEYSQIHRLGWFAIQIALCLLILIAMVPWLMDKKHTHPPRPRWEPVFLWLACFASAVWQAHSRIALWG